MFTCLLIWWLSWELILVTGRQPSSHNLGYYYLLEIAEKTYKSKWTCDRSWDHKLLWHMPSNTAGYIWLHWCSRHIYADCLNEDILVISVKIQHFETQKYNISVHLDYLFRCDCAIIRTICLRKSVSVRLDRTKPGLLCENNTAQPEVILVLCKAEK